MAKKYTTLLFDADNTLLDFNKDERQALIRTLEEYSVPISDENIKIYTEINKGLWKQFEKGEITKPELKRIRFRKFFEKIGFKTDTDPFVVNERYLFLLGDMGGNTLNGAKELLGELKKDGYDIYIVTNGVALTQAKRLDRSGLLPFISEVFVSETVGHQKPKKEFFDFVFDKINEKNKDSILLIGDSLSSDIKGAMNAGINSVWLNLFSENKPDEYKPDYIITDITELRAVIL